MSKLAGHVVERLREFGRGRPLDVGLFARGNLAVVEQIAAVGHRVLVISDRFRWLHGAHRCLEGAGSAKFLALEARFDGLPLRRRSLDVLLLPGGLPVGDPAAHALGLLREPLRPGGMLLWLHPSAEGVRGRLGRLLSPLRMRAVEVMARPDLCALTMAADYGEIQQAWVSGGLWPWVITSGIVGSRPWESGNI